MAAAGAPSAPAPAAQQQNVREHERGACSMLVSAPLQCPGITSHLRHAGTTLQIENLKSSLVAVGRGVAERLRAGRFYQRYS